ncbi:hypothetical protein [Halobellus rufus]|uniref:hypothetical protein n=1 Tax=Halobellus rufus TaxID=1448860 RepID=UPI000679CEB6|nr:hypothetical protein [Halobellus rufus]
MPMRQLRNCDFCGGDAAGVYEAVPQELSPTEAEQRRVVLCENCLETLETVVDPLLSRPGVDRDGESAATAGGPAATANESSSSTSDPAPTAEPTGSAERREAVRRESGDSEPSTASTEDGTSPVEADGETARAAGSSTDSEPPSPSDSPSRATPPNRFGAPDGYTDIAEYDGFEDEVDEAEDPAEAEQTRAPDPREDHVERDGPPSPSEPEPESVDAAAADRGGVGEEPEDFRTVMRLLGNREFPVERSAVVELAAGAYQLEDAHVHRILDHAVERGVLTDEDGTLRKS